MGLTGRDTVGAAPSEGFGCDGHPARGAGVESGDQPLDHRDGTAGGPSLAGRSGQPCSLSSDGGAGRPRSVAYCWIDLSIAAIVEFTNLWSAPTIQLWDALGGWA